MSLEIVGNIITVGMCFILIVIFRHLDKSNNSLEKMRRFCDKQKADFSNYVTTMKQGLENAAVDVRTMMDRASAAVATLKDTRTVLAKEEEELSARRQEVAAFMRKIKESGDTITQLTEAIAAADKNLAKIAKESDFADSVGVTIQNAKKEMEAISASLAQIEQRFTRENAAALSAVREEIFSRLADDVEEINGSLEKARRESERLERTAYENLQRVYDGLFDKASERAEKMEDQVFEKLQGQALARLEKYKETIEKRTAELTQTAKDKLGESQQLLRNFKADWKNQADSMLREVKTNTEVLFAEQSESQKAFFEKLKADTQTLSEKISATAASSEKTMAAVEEKLAGFEENTAYELSRLGGIMDEIPAIDNKLRLSLQDLEKKTDAAFDLFTQDQNARRDTFEEAFNARRDNFEEAFNARTESLVGKIQNIENSVTELKNHAYANVSEKMQIFEDDFTKDLAKRSATLSAQLENWQANIEGRLEALSTKNEAERTDAETEYTEKLKERLAGLAETYRAHTDKLETQMTNIEQDLRTRIANSTAAIQAFSEQYRAEFLQAKENADALARNELQTHSIELQEALRKQRMEMDARCRELVDAIDSAKENSEAMVKGINENISEWERKNERVMDAVSGEINAKLEEFKGATLEMIAHIEADSRDDFSAAVKRIGNDTLELQNSIEELRGKILTAGDDVDERSRLALENFSAQFNDLSRKAERRAEDAAKEAEDATVAFRASVMEANASLEETRQRLFKKMQGDVDAVSATVEELGGRIQGAADDVDERSRLALENFSAQFNDLSKEAERRAEDAAKEAEDATVAFRASVMEANASFEETRQKLFEELRGKILTAGDDLDERSRLALENFSAQFNDLSKKAERRAEDAAKEAEDATVAFRTAVMEANNAFEETRQRLFKKMQGDIDAVSATVEELGGRIQGAADDVDERSRAALENFSAQFNDLSRKAERRAEDAAKEAEDATVAFRASVMEANASLEETRQRLFKKMQGDIDVVFANLDEIAAKQKSFMEQTRLFTRADELKTNLEESIEKLKIEVAGFSVYQETMGRIESNYKQIQKLEEEAGQKLNAMTSNKKRIDTMEEDFNRLLGLSSKIDERISNLTRVNDDVQDYQARIRSFEESITEVNARYERLSKKSTVLDQTIDGIDKAFDSLSKLEKNLHSYREEAASLPEDMVAIRSKMDFLLDVSERAGVIESKVIQLENELSEVEKRSERIQAAKKTFANTEKRLTELKKEADKEIGLFRALAKGQGSQTKKDPHAPPISIRENVKDLKHREWTVEEIAKSLNLSKSEVELILEMPD